VLSGARGNGKLLPLPFTTCPDSTCRVPILSKMLSGNSEQSRLILSHTQDAKTFSSWQLDVHVSFL
jgi:hypothetical protein